MAASANRRRARMNNSLPRPRDRRLSVEPLEERLAMYAVNGASWSNPNLSFSYVPDGTSSDGYTSTLFSKLDAVAPRAVWQHEFARALQTWANVSNLNFHEVADSGTPSGGSGAQGDIRLAAIPNGGSLAYAYYPSTSYTIGGDVFLATEYNFAVGSDYDLYSVLLHETGHSLGLSHASGSVMNASYQGVLTGLTSDDIAGIRSIYGARSDDAFDAAARNDSLAAATVLTLDSSGVKSLTGDLTSLGDIDYYRVTAPTSSDGTLRVSVDARDISLLQGRVLVYDASGHLLSSSDAATYEGQAEANLTGITAGQTYYVVADGAVSDAFGMGKYGLTIAFGGGSTPPPPQPPPSGIAADRFESNDSLSAASSLGKFNSRTEIGLTLHTSTDQDAFAFTAKTSGTYRIATTFASATGEHELRIYDSQRNLIAGGTGASLDLVLTAGRRYFVQVGSPSGTLDTYDLAIQKYSGTSTKGGNQKNALSRDRYFADAASVVQHQIQAEINPAAIDRLLTAWKPDRSPGARSTSSPATIRASGATQMRRAMRMPSTQIFTAAEDAFEQSRKLRRMRQ
jgi:hypothetical protein